MPPAPHRPAQVAVIGYACRLPGAETVAQAWSVMNEGRCTVAEIPEDRWSTQRFMDPAGQTRGRSFVRKAGIISDLWDFDTHYFGISPREAEIMDPQQRMLMETTARALDHAGVDAAALDGARTGVFVGASNADHAVFGAYDPERIEAFYGLGNTLSILANRLSYHWNFRGPSYVVDSACSSALVALDRARRDIASGEIDTAIVGGVNVLLAPGPFVAFSAASMLSRKGLCQAFGAGADGYVRSEGAVVFVLQRAGLARRSGARVRSILAGTGVGADGRTNGMALPSQTRQTDLMTAVLAEAHVDPNDIAFAEAHGTGTPVGDPREALSLGAAIGQKRGAALPIGSAKSNFGHLEPAAGLVGLLKAQLALEHGLIPASLHASDPNPEIDFAGLNLDVVQSARPIAARDAPWAAVVNSFGFGGTNAHAVLCQPDRDGVTSVPRTKVAPAMTGAANGAVAGGTPEAMTETQSAPLPPALLLSAGTKPALKALARMWRDIAQHDPSDLGQALSDANRRITRHTERLCAPAGSGAALADALDAWLDGNDGSASPISTSTVFGDDLPLAFVFCGNGAVWQGMARGLMTGDTEFRRSFEETCALFGPDAAEALIAQIWAEDAGAALGDSATAQSLLFAIQLGLVDALAAAGVRPCAVLGHSAGEVAAAAAAGRISRRTGAALIRIRAATVERTRGLGTMAAIAAGRDIVSGLIRDHAPEVEIAAENAPENVTLTGRRADIEEVLRQARARGIAGKLLLIDYPYHSHFMDSAREEFRADVAAMPLAGVTEQTGITFVSGWATEAETPDILDADYWWSNMRQPVAFRTGLETLRAADCGVFLEIGPRPVLQRDIRDTLAAAGTRATALPSLRDNQTTSLNAAQIARAVLCAGGRVDADLILGERQPFLSDLPDYPFDRQEFRLDTSAGLWVQGHPTDHPFLGWRERSDSTEWRGSLSLARMPWLGDHRVDGAAILPATGILSMMCAAAAQVMGSDTFEVRDLEILMPIDLSDGKEHATFVTYDATARRIAVHTGAPGRWSLVAVGGVATFAGSAPAPLTLNAQKDPADIYASLEAAGLSYGPAFRQLLGATDFDAHADIVLAEGLQTPERWVACVDSALHGLIALLKDTDLARDCPLVPRRFGRLRRFSNGFPQGARITLRDHWADGLCADVMLTDAAGRGVMALDDVRFQTIRLSGRAVPALWDEVEIGVAGDRAPVLAKAVADAQASGATVPSDLEILRDSLGTRMAWDEMSAAIAGALPTSARTGVAMDHLMAIGALHVDDDGVPVLSDAPPVPDAETLSVLLAQTVPDASAELHAALAHVVAAGAHPLDCGKTTTAASPKAAMAEKPPAPERPLVNGVDDDDADEVPNSIGEAQISVGEATANVPESTSPAVPAQPDRALAEQAAAILWSVAREGPRRIVLAGDVDHALCEAAQAIGDHVTVTASNPDALERLQANLGDLGALCFATLGELDQRGAAAEMAVGVALAQDRGGDLAPGLAALLVQGGEMLVMEQTPDIFALMTGRYESANALERLRLSVARADIDLTLKPTSANMAVTLGYGTVPDRPVPFASFAVSGDGPLADALRTVSPPPQPTDAATQDDAQPNDTAPPEQADAAPQLAPWVHVLPPGTDIAASLAKATAIRDLPFGDGQASPQWIVCEGDAETAAELSGWRRVAVNETGRDIRVLTVAPGIPAEAVARALACRAEHELRLTPTGLSTNRVMSLTQRVPGFASGPDSAGNTTPADAVRLDLSRRSAALDGLCWRTVPRIAPRCGEVEIAVAASGLNFRDVMWAQGLLPYEILEEGSAGPTLGLECAGTVVRAGPDAGIEVGAQVMAVCGGGFASHITLPDTAVVRVPDGIAPQIAASIPVAFQTADYALRGVARLEPGETVLIHGGAGGVGLAAVQIAQAEGARILATAGTPAKRRLLRALGVDDVFDSRTLAFEQAVDAATGGAGVDVVLNSLAGEAMERSLACLAPFGRFLELGKRDFVANSALGLRVLRRNISYHAIDLDQLAAARPEKALKSLARVMDGFADGSLRPNPVDVYPAENVGAAFRQMQRSGHIGKIVIRAPIPERHRSKTPPGPAPDLAGRWLIVGGTGGFGLATAEWLAGQGATALWLASRGGTVPGDAMARLTEAGIAVYAVALDVTDADAVTALGAQIAETSGTLDGIVHAAMVLHDALLSDLQDDQMREVLSVKIDGAKALGALADAHAVRHFWLYSSVAGRFGNPWQAPYAAANRVLDAMAVRRRATGAPALAVAWGPIGDAGYLARAPDIRDLADRLGPLMTAQHALGRLASALTDDPSRATITIAPAQWGKVKHDLPVIAGPLFDLIDIRRDALGAAGLDLSALIASHGEARARQIVLDMLIAETGRLLHMAPSDVDSLRPLEEMGFDSLMAMSLKLAVEETLGTQIAASELRAGLNLSLLVNTLFDQLSGEGGALREEAALIGTHVADSTVSEVLRSKIIDRTDAILDYYAEPE